MTDTDTLLRFVHISDTHINPDPSYIKPYAHHTPMVGARALIQAIRELPFAPDFVLHTGDVAYDPHPEVYNTVHELTAELPCPIYYVAGNHDHMEALQTVIMGRNADQVQPNLHYELELNGVQLLALDSNDEAPDPSGRVPEAQIAWLAERCAAADTRPLIVAVHHNAIPVGVPWLDDWMRMINGEDFHQALLPARDRLRGVFYGHIHQNITTFREGILYVAAASSWAQFASYPMPENERVSEDMNTPGGFSVVTITHERTHIRRHHFRVSEQ